MFFPPNMTHLLQPMDLVVNSVVKSAMRKRRIEMLRMYFRDYQVECRRNQRLQPPLAMPGFDPPSPSIIDGLIKIRERSLLNDSFKLSHFLGYFKVLDWCRLSQALIRLVLMLFTEDHTPSKLSKLQKRFGLQEDEALCEKRDKNSIGGFVLGLRCEAMQEKNAQNMIMKPWWIPLLPSQMQLLKYYSYDESEDDERI